MIEDVEERYDSRNQRMNGSPDIGFKKRWPSLIIIIHSINCPEVQLTR